MLGYHNTVPPTRRRTNLGPNRLKPAVATFQFLFDPLGFIAVILRGIGNRNYALAFMGTVNSLPVAGGSS